MTFRLFAQFGIEFEDITEDVIAIAKSRFLLNLGVIDTKEKVKLSASFELKECSSDIEVADPRTDSRAKLHFRQPLDTIKEEGLKLPSELTNEEICSIYDEVFIREMNWITGRTHLISSFYDFTFTHSPSLLAENGYISALINYSHASMSRMSDLLSIYQVHGFARFDDYHISFIKFMKSQGIDLIYF